MNTRPEGYAPDLFSEHARLAQLGLYARELVAELRPNLAPLPAGSLSEECNNAQIVGAFRRLAERASELDLAEVQP